MCCDMKIDLKNINWFEKLKSDYYLKEEVGVPEDLRGLN